MFGRDLRRLVDELVPPAPWLEDRVMAGVRDEATSRSRRSNAAPDSTRLLGALLIALLTVVVLLGTRIAGESTRTQVTGSTPSRDPAIVSYRAVITTGMNTVYSAFGAHGYCRTRQECIAVLVKTRTAAAMLLESTSASQPPAPVGQVAANFQTELHQFMDQLDVAIFAMQVPGSDFVAASVAPTINGLDLAAAEIICWPVLPVPRSDLRQGYGCSAET